MDFSCGDSCRASELRRRLPAEQPGKRETWTFCVLVSDLQKRHPPKGQRQSVSPISSAKVCGAIQVSHLPLRSSLCAHHAAACPHLTYSRILDPMDHRTSRALLPAPCAPQPVHHNATHHNVYLTYCPLSMRQTYTTRAAPSSSTSGHEHATCPHVQVPSHDLPRARLPSRRTCLAATRSASSARARHELGTRSARSPRARHETATRSARCRAASRRRRTSAASRCGAPPASCRWPARSLGLR
jgi:hypothetical protein